MLFFINTIRPMSADSLITTHHNNLISILRSVVYTEGVILIDDESPTKLSLSYADVGSDYWILRDEYGCYYISSTTITYIVHGLTEVVDIIPWGITHLPLSNKRLVQHSTLYHLRRHVDLLHALDIIVIDVDDTSMSSTTTEDIGDILSFDEVSH